MLFGKTVKEEDVEKISEGISLVLSRISNISDRLQALEDRLGLERGDRDETIDSVLAERMYGENKNGGDK